MIQTRGSTPVIARYGKFEYVLADHYRFEDELGRGAMGTVYRAQDVRLGRPVAIKMLHPMLTNELGIARFQSEIRIAAGLHHPNIIGVHESGEADGRLFYVMDYLGGETLRDRLNREKQLSVEDALGIVEQVAEGLQYAHDHGVVHRDVKPENILLAEGRACVVDFGLARALGDVNTERLTASGLSVGTPHYLSPEQAAAEKEVGPKADQYALACVLYEMLVGEPPFTGPTATSIAMRHITEEARPLRLRRHTAPIAVEVAVMRAMEKVPADRYASVKEFAKTLRARASAFPKIAPVKPNRRMAYGGVAIFVILAIGGSIVTAIVRSDTRGVASLGDVLQVLAGRSLDTSKYVVFPLAKSGLAAGTDVDQQLSDAFAQWRGLSVPGASELREAMNGRVEPPATTAMAAAIAKSIRAGRFVIGDVTAEKGLLRVRVELRDVSGRAAPRSASIAIPSSGSDQDTLFRHLAFVLLFGSDATRFEGAANGTKSTVALDAYLRGRAAMSDWNLIGADSAFSISLRADPNFPQASLALAQVREWTRDNAPEVGAFVVRALDGAGRLSASDRLHAEALKSLSVGQYPDACIRYDSLIKRDPKDFPAWFGISECNRRDSAVVTDRRSPTGKSFRGSSYQAIAALNRAFDLLPRIDSCCSARVATLLRRAFKYTINTEVRLGYGVWPDSNLYGAYPQQVGDTLATIPIPRRYLTRPPPATHEMAVQHLRNEFLSVASKRVALSPHSADALELLAEALELHGDPASVDTTRRARALSTTPSQVLRLAVSEAWLRVKYAMPDDVNELAAVRVFADSLLAKSVIASPRDAELLASLAALVGDANRGARLSEQSAAATSPQDPMPREVQGTAQALLAYAAVGGPVDSLRELERRLTIAIANGVVPQQQAEARATYLARPLGLAYPVYHSTTFNQLDTADYLIAAEMAHLRGDRQALRRILGAAAKIRSGLRPADLTLDGLYPEAWLLAAIGDSAAAYRTIAPTLEAVRAIPVRLMFDVADAGALVQSMLLLAQLGHARGDRTTGIRWARATVALTDTSLSIARLVRHQALELAR